MRVCVWLLILGMFLVASISLNIKAVNFGKDQLVNDISSSVDIPDFPSVDIKADINGSIYVVWDNYIDGDWDIYFAISSDRGSSFNLSIQINDDIGDYEQGAPSIAIDNYGTIYVVWGDNRNGDYDIYFAKSIDGGISFCENIQVNDLAENSDQYNPSIDVDGEGNIYVVWEDNRNDGGDIYLSMSIDGGFSFSTDIKVNDESGSSVQHNPSLALGESGSVFVIWEDGRNGYSDIYLAKSADHASSFGEDVRVDDTGDDESYQQMPSIAVSEECMYVAWEDKRNGNYDIYFAKSIDGGASFSQNIKVNDDSDYDQRSPYINADSEINIVWEDWRNDTNSIYFAESLDGGKSFTQDVQVDDRIGSDPYLPSLSVDGDGNVYIAWVDSRNQNMTFDVYCAASTPLSPTGLTVTDLGIGETLNICWDVNAEPTVIAYNLYRSNAPGGPYIKIAEDATSTEYTDAGLEDGITYYYTVTAIDDTANESPYSREASNIPSDKTPPSPPTGLTVAPWYNSLNLSWAQNLESDVAGYKIYRSVTSGGPYTLITVLGNATTWQDTGLSGDKTYYYVIAAYDEVPNESSYSDEANGTPTTPSDTIPPERVTGLTVTDTGVGSTLFLSWNKVPDLDLKGYKIYRSMNMGEDYVLLTTTLNDTTTYNDTNLIDGKKYYYAVSALDLSNNEGEISAEVFAIPTDITPPTIPTNLTLTFFPSNNTLNITWDANTESDLLCYKLYMSTNNSIYTLKAVIQKGVERYLDSNLSTGTIYYYKITAVDDSLNESPLSDEIFYYIPGEENGNHAALISAIVILFAALGISMLLIKKKREA